METILKFVGHGPLPYTIIIHGSYTDFVLQVLKSEVDDYKLSISDLESSVKQLNNDKEDYLSELEVLRDNKEVGIG